MTQYPKDCWPTDEQKLLLHAALQHGEASVAAWELWMEAIDFSDIDFGSQRLIPLLYAKLSENGIHHQMMASYKGLYRNFWLKNKLLLTAANPVLQELYDNNIETLILKGTGIILGCNIKLALRPMGDIDFMVHKEKVSLATNIMHKIGWQPKQFYPSDLDLIHAYSFNNGKGQSIDLHWYSLDTDLTDLHTAGYWDRSIMSQLSEVPVQIMGVTDQLMHTCVHGIRWNRVPPIRWIADAIMLYEKPDTEIQWDLLIELSEKLKVSILLFQGLSYLQSEFNIPIPDYVLQSLERIPVSYMEKLEFKLSQKKRQPFLGLFTYNKKFFDYLKFHRKKFPFPGYLRYLQTMWGVNNLWQVPFIGLSRMWKEIQMQFSRKNQG